MPSNQLEYIFESLPDGVIACDREGRILRINATALKLFEVPSEHLARGTPCQQFLHSYQLDLDQQQQQRLAPERTIVLDRMPTEKAVSIIADANRMTQAINSYLVNALHYAPADQPVTVQLTVEDGVARVSVHDKGPGIPLEEQEHIWERFYHAREITGQHELDLSLGLGLYLCQVFIERHQGSVGVQSEPGHGTTFWFTLPIETSTEDEG